MGLASARLGRVPLALRACLDARSSPLGKHLLLSLSLHPVCKPVSLLPHPAAGNWSGLRGAMCQGNPLGWNPSSLDKTTQ